MARSIPSTPIPPPGICRAFSHLSFSICQRGSVPGGGGVGHCQTYSVFRTFKVTYCSTPTSANICTIVSDLRTRDDKNKNAHGTWKSCSFSWYKPIWAITDPIKIHLFVSDHCFPVPQVGHLHSFRSPTAWGICTRKLASPWGICNNFEIKRQMPDKWPRGDGRAWSWSSHYNIVIQYR